MTAQQLPQLAFAFIANLQFSTATRLTTDDEKRGANYAMDVVVVCRRRTISHERQLTLEATLRRQKPDVEIPYSAKVTAVVVLSHIDESLSPEEADEHATQIACPIAYSMIRDELLNLTGKGPHIKLLLPIIGRQDLCANVEFHDVDGTVLPHSKEPSTKAAAVSK